MVPISAKILIQSPNMAKLPMTKAALKRALAEIHPDPEIAREFFAIGIYQPSPC